jgi:hypothetical protein
MRTKRTRTTTEMTRTRTGGLGQGRRGLGQRTPRTERSGTTRPRWLRRHGPSRQSRAGCESAAAAGGGQLRERVRGQEAHQACADEEPSRAAGPADLDRSSSHIHCSTVGPSLSCRTACTRRRSLWALGLQSGPGLELAARSLLPAACSTCPPACPPRAGSCRRVSPRHGGALSPVARAPRAVKPLPSMTVGTTRTGSPSRCPTSATPTCPPCVINDVSMQALAAGRWPRGIRLVGSWKDDRWAAMKDSLPLEGEGGAHCLISVPEG